jgi:ubiquitin carboxyl-terminal hydrolase 1
VLKNVVLSKTMSRVSTKQIMIARPPRILALHLNRSSYSASAWAASKNNRQVLFPEMLDVGAVTLGGSISVDGREAMNGARRGAGPCYRLAAIVVHYGSHAFGHYVAFKRVPDASLDDADAWLRISDASVTHASLAHVQCENPFMLFYELLPPVPAVADADVHAARQESTTSQSRFPPRCTRPRTVHRWSTPPVH